MLTTLFNRVQEQSEVPSAWKRGRVVLIHKKGAKHEVNNYRPLTVLTSMNSLFSKTMNARLSDVVERHRLLGEVQNGFSFGGSTCVLICKTQCFEGLKSRPPASPRPEIKCSEIRSPEVHDNNDFQAPDAY